MSNCQYISIYLIYDWTWPFRYQVHFKVLQAGHYGAPQGRQRVIFLGARCDVPLPQFPSPQHHFPQPVLLHHLPNGEALHPHFRPTTCSHTVKMPCVPLPTTTVGEAIGDLVSYVIDIIIEVK